MATVRETYTISEEIVKKLNKYSLNNMIPKSKIVNKLLKGFLKKNENKKT